MTRQINVFTGPVRTIAGAMALTALVAFGIAPPAEANTAANTTIRNTVTVNFDDTAGTPMTAVTDDVDVTVTLVESTPTLSAPADGSTDPATGEVYSYTLTATANGPDTYNLTEASVTDSAGDFAVGSTTTFSTPSLTLGATTVATAGNIAAAGTTAITVPSDSAVGGGVNGIIAGDTVVINGQVFTVDSVTDNGGAPGTSTITVNGNGTLTAIAVGDVIGEQQSFTLTVNPGTLVASPSSPVTVTVAINARDDAAAANAATDTTITTITFPALDVVKEVSTDGGATFSAGPVGAAPAATLTYRVTVTNSGSSAASSVLLTDPAPQFTTYVPGSAKSDTTTGTTYAAAATSLTDGVDGDGYDFNVTTGNTATFNAGTVNAGSSVLLFFQVTIN